MMTIGPQCQHRCWLAALFCHDTPPLHGFECRVRYQAAENDPAPSLAVGYGPLNWWRCRGTDECEQAQRIQAIPRSFPERTYGPVQEPGGNRQTAVDGNDFLNDIRGMVSNTQGDKRADGMSNEDHIAPILTAEFLGVGKREIGRGGARAMKGCAVGEIYRQVIELR